MKIARLCGFLRRKPRKLDLRAFLLSAMALPLLGRASLRQQAMLLGLSANITISKQALHKRIADPALSFLQNCLAAAISWRMRTASNAERPAMQSFQRILIQDSTCLALPPTLAKSFPGASNQSGKAQACLRIQCIYDLMAENFVTFVLSGFTRNDQNASTDILPVLRAGDLLLRDLGYFTLHSLHEIANKGAAFLTRLRFGTSVIDPATGLALDWKAILSKGASLDMQVWLGKDLKLPVRLIAIPLPEAVANQRRRKARANRDRRLNHDELYFYLLGWSIFVTNANEELLPCKKLAGLYRLRWRIEILFRSWKSHLALKNPHRVGEAQLKLLVCGLLLFSVLMHSCMQAPPGTTGRPGQTVSLLRFADFLATFLLLILIPGASTTELSERLFKQIQAHGHYDKRKRANYNDMKEAALS